MTGLTTGSPGYNRGCTVLWLKQHQRRMFAMNVICEMYMDVMEELSLTRVDVTHVRPDFKPMDASLIAWMCTVCT